MVATFSIVTVVAIAVQTIALIALHLLPTGYDPKTDAVSDYGIANPDGYAECPPHAVQGELPARTDRRLGRAGFDRNVAKKRGQC